MMVLNRSPEATEQNPVHTPEEQKQMFNGCQSKRFVLFLYKVNQGNFMSSFLEFGSVDNCTLKLVDDRVQMIIITKQPQKAHLQYFWLR